MRASFSQRVGCYLSAWAVVSLFCIASREAVADQPARFTNSLGMEFVSIPAGEFEMGIEEPVERAESTFSYQPASRFQYELPVHHVRITRPFYLATCEVTVGQLRQFCREAPYQLESERDGLPDWTHINHSTT